MTLTNALFNNAELSMATYGVLEPGSTSDQINELTSENVGMSQQQAQEFAAKFPEVVTQFDDPGTGFSATVFNDDFGNLTLAFRGTEQFIEDLFFTDSLIAFNGAGYDQIVAMYNWWQRVSTPSGQSVEQYKTTTFDPDDSEFPEPGSVFLYASAQGLVYLEKLGSESGFNHNTDIVM